MHITHLGIQSKALEFVIIDDEQGQNLPLFRACALVKGCEIEGWNSAGAVLSLTGACSEAHSQTKILAVVEGNLDFYNGDLEVDPFIFVREFALTW